MKASTGCRESVGGSPGVLVGPKGPTVEQTACTLVLFCSHL